MIENIDRLYELLPAFYRIKDAEQGFPLKALLQIIAEQVNVVEDDIDQLYDNWFIETCQDWVVPYIGDLIGYKQVHDTGETVDNDTYRGQKHNKIFVPRLEVANTIAYRRRKGTLALLDQLGKDITGWSSHAIELRKSLGFIQNINHLQMGLANTIDLCKNEALNRLNGPFDSTAHTADLRTFGSDNRVSYNIPGVGLFVWRLKDYPVTMTPACRVKNAGPQSYTFSALGNDIPLYTHPDTESAVNELRFPMPIKRWALKAHRNDYYGAGKNIQIWVGECQNDGEVLWSGIDADRVVAADLSKWQCIPANGQVAVDPELGRIAFPSGTNIEGVKVSYYYGFSSDIGGGEYDRQLSQPKDYRLYKVGKGKIESINEALLKWQKDKEDPNNGSDESKNELMHAVIEIIESGVYDQPTEISLDKKESLQIRAANRVRPILRQIAEQTNGTHGLSVTGLEGSSFTLDGLLLADSGMQIKGNLGRVTIRHSTLISGLPRNPENETKLNFPSLKILDTQACLFVDRSILGSIEMNQNDAITDPTSLCISDSVLDATDSENSAVYSNGSVAANIEMTVLRSTIIGKVMVHDIKLAEDSIFYGKVKVARRQQGCMRFCYLTPGSRTPRRYECQPELAIKSAEKKLGTTAKGLTEEVRKLIEDRVLPPFTSKRFGNPAYCQLSFDCAAEIKRGAEDESEMGVFHDLYQPQRESSLRIRLEEYTPAEIETGIVFMS